MTWLILDQPLTFHFEARCSRGYVVDVLLRVPQIPEGGTGALLLEPRAQGLILDALVHCHRRWHLDELYSRCAKETDDTNKKEKGRKNFFYG